MKYQVSHSNHNGITIVRNSHGNALDPVNDRKVSDFTQDQIIFIFGSEEFKLQIM